MSQERKRHRETSNEILDSSLFWRIARPLPSTNVLVALAPSNNGKIKIPLLKDFIGDQFFQEGISEAEQHTKEGNAQIIPINDPRNSTITKGQHERYLQVQHSFKTHRYSHQHREYHKLHLLVKAEQQAYRKARNEFFAKNARRFLSGFRLIDNFHTRSDYVNWNAKYSKICIEEWRMHKFPIKFGKVRQNVSLSLSSDIPVDKNFRKTRNWMPTERFDSRVISHEKAETQGKNSEQFLAEKLPIALPTKMKLPPVPLFVKNNEEALELAKQHGCSAIVSAEALEEILTQPKWNIPLWNSSPTLRILDHPLPQPMLPRTCITKGIEKTLHSEYFVLDNDSQMMYTLLKMQSEGNKEHNILVQSRRLATQKYQRIHLEYFPEQGLEELSNEEKSLWILDSLLAPHMPIELLRVNVEEGSNDWKVHVRESVSVAHALACDNATLRSLWSRLTIVLDAVVDIRLPTNGDYLLKHTDEIGDFISLHHANDEEWIIDLEDEFQNADVVKTGNAALLACARPWKWSKGNRVLDTFPLKNED